MVIVFVGVLDVCELIVNFFVKKFDVIFDGDIIFCYLGECLCDRFFWKNFYVDFKRVVLFELS